MASQILIDWSSSPSSPFLLLSFLSLLPLLPLAFLSLWFSSPESGERNQPTEQEETGSTRGTSRGEGRVDGRDFLSFSVWVASDSLGFASLILWVAYAPFLLPPSPLLSFGYAYGLTFVGSAIGSLLVLPSSSSSSRHRRILFVLSSLLSFVSSLRMSSSPPLPFPSFLALTLLFLAFRSFSSNISQAEALCASPFSSAGLSSGVYHSSRLGTASLSVLTIASSLLSPRKGIVLFSLLSSLVSLLSLFRLHPNTPSALVSTDGKEEGGEKGDDKDEPSPAEERGDKQTSRQRNQTEETCPFSPGEGSLAGSSPS